jgi:NADH dehydrogenase
MTSVVIVGSGFTGFECARHLARKLRKHNTSVDISIISPVDYMLYTPLLPDVAGGLVDPRFVAIPLANALRGVQQIRGRVDGVDFDGHTVTFTDPEERARTLPWDRLVLTPGSVTRLFDVPGLAEHARGLKSTAEALYLRDHVLEQLELADVDDDPGRAAARRTIVVVGASYSGTELVVQLRALADSAAKQMNFDPADVKFVLLDMAEQVMPEVGEKLGAAAQRVLKSRGVDVRLGVTLKEVHAEHVVLSDDSLIRTHTVAWVTGVTGAPLIEKLGLPTEKGRLKVQTDLQVPGHPDVFGAGDAAAVPDVTQPGKITPPTARDPAGKGVGAQRRRESRLRQEEDLQAPQHGVGRRPRSAIRRRQPTQHPVVRHRSQGRHPRLPSVCDSAGRQPLGGVAGLPDRRVLRSFGGFIRPVVAGGCAVLRERGHPDAESGLVGGGVPVQFEMTAGA